MKAARIVVLTIVYTLSFTKYALAYIDPGMGALALQGVLAMLLTVGVFWRRTKSFVTGLFRRQPQEHRKEVEHEEN